MAILAYNVLLLADSSERAGSVFATKRLTLSFRFELGSTIPAKEVRSGYEKLFFAHQFLSSTYPA